MEKWYAQQAYMHATSCPFSYVLTSSAHGPSQIDVLLGPHGKRSKQLTEASMQSSSKPIEGSA